MSFKIVIGGPPRSGKSRFFAGLCANLPRDERFFFRACPDGEATWTWKGNGAEQYRRKGTFSQENMDWYVQSLRNCDLAPVVLVDIGGRTSDENRRICAECNAAIILVASNQPEQFAVWSQFFASLNIPVLAVIASDMNVTEDSENSDPMVCHFLDRSVADAELAERPVIRKVAEQIRENSETEIQKFGEKNMNTNGMISIGNLAEQLGKAKNEKGQYQWAGADLPKIAELLHNRSAEMSEVVKVDGAAPAWLVSALVHECHPREAELNSPDGYIRVGCRKPEGTGVGIEFSVTPKAEGWTLVEYKLNPSIPLKPTALLEIAPPEVPMGSKVILSGRGPNWLTASLAMAYHGPTKAVACFQPGTGATVCMTHSAEVALGAVVQI